MPLKIATWNVNSIKVRLPRLLDYLDAQAPDVIVLQEIKSIDDNFPRTEIEERGYAIETHGQKTYNGVAILSKLGLEDVTRGLPGDDGDEQARYIEATIPTDNPVRIAGLYLPNGNPAPGEKFDYKLAWMQRLLARADHLLAQEQAFVMLGDYNVIPDDEDVHDADAWAGDALIRPESRTAFRALMAKGLTDAYRACSPRRHRYTFWDYQAGAWNKDHGIRIDHLLLSPEAADRLQSAGIDKYTRGEDKPSDHVPVWCELTD